MRFRSKDLGLVAILGPKKMQSDPAWVAIELYARVVPPLQLLVEFPDLPYVPFGQQQPRRNAYIPFENIVGEV